MNPKKVIRNNVRVLTDLPNIGKSMERALLSIDIQQPNNLIGQSPSQMYEELCQKTAAKQDPCVLDVFISITRFMEGEDPKPWWKYTRERKEYLKEQTDNKEQKGANLSF
ncbi:MAG: helix-hairpin-helix domain-containing protein [Candidatus Electrothrix sp. GW3-4]|uniref:helix-hairpin-helix domain-containing protein n=1 Tax=Candidatus Electrothrix sp. GW3-4 TaxID=3126740 RepID=UPI0030D0EE57